MINKKLPHSEIEQKLAQTLQRTRQRFVEDLSLKISEIETLKSLIQNEAERPNALARLAFIVHRFSGVGATLGFHDIGNFAAKVELHISGFNHTETQLSLLSERIEMLLDLMEDAVVEAL